MSIIVDANMIESLEECLEWTLERIHRLGIQLPDTFDETELYKSCLGCLQMIVVRVLGIDQLKEKTEFTEEESNLINFALGQLCTEVEVNVDDNLADIRDLYMNFLKTKVPEQTAILLWTFIEGYYSF